MALEVDLIGAGSACLEEPIGQSFGAPFVSNGADAAAQPVEDSVLVWQGGTVDPELEAQGAGGCEFEANRLEPRYQFEVLRVAVVRSARGRPGPDPYRTRCGPEAKAARLGFESSNRQGGGSLMGHLILEDFQGLVSNALDGDALAGRGVNGLDKNLGKFRNGEFDVFATAARSAFSSSPETTRPGL